MFTMHIAVDLDDVTVDFWPGVLHAFETEFGIHLEPMHPWGPQAVAFGKHPAFLAAGYSSWWGWLRDREWLWAGFGAVPGAIGGIKMLRERGHYVEAVTSKPDWAEHNVWKWLGKWRPPFNRVTIINAKGGQRKVDFTDAQLIIDDKFETCVEFNEAARGAIWFNQLGAMELDQEELLNPYLRVARDWHDVLIHAGGMAHATV